MNRRRFVQMFALATAASGAWRGELLGAVQPAAAGAAGRIRISIDDFPTLRNEFSSIRLSVNPLLPGGEPFPDGDFYPILINRGERDLFYALDSACRHAGCVVPIYDESLGGIFCVCHGSGYAIDGTVIQGPATESLRRFEITFDGVNTLTIEIPGLGYEVAARRVEGNRVRLAFPTHLNVSYEVYFRPSFDAGGGWQPVSFASSPDGPLDQSQLSGSGDPVVVFAARSAAMGFYAVRMVVLDLT